MKKRILSWCLYDAGSTAFSTVIITFVYSVFFARRIVDDAVWGSALWGYALAAAGLVIAVAAPVLGAFADHYGGRRTFLRGFSLLCIAATALLYGVPPGAGHGHIAAALGLVAAGAVGLECALVFSYAMLPALAPAAMLGRVSGWAWASGYAGGLVCLCLALIGLVGLGGHAPLLHLPTDAAQNVRAVTVLTALWYLALALPLLLTAPDAGRTGLPARAALRAGLHDIGMTLHSARGHRDLILFLVASAIYRDGMNTLFAVGGLFAAGTFGLTFTQILIFAVGLNVMAGIGAAAFAFADDHWGSRRTIMTGLAGLIVTGTVILCLHDRTLFIAAAMALGIFVGPAQAASRTLAARLSPPDTVAGTFGLYALTGKATAFAGPLLFGVLTQVTGSQRAGLAVIVAFWLIGLALLSQVRERRA